MLFLKRKKSFFSEEEKQAIVEAVRMAEQQTSGEVRVFVESRCKYVDAIDRAIELFHSLKMEQTAERNGVLIYIAIKDRQLAIYGDEGIHQKVGSEWWEFEVKKMISAFKRDDCAAGIIQCVTDVGNALKQHFPYDRGTDKNELPDDIVFGS